MGLQTKNWLRYFLKKRKGINPDVNPLLRAMNEYNKVSHDKFFSSTYDINKLNSKYNTQYDWGSVHPYNTTQQFTKNNVFIGEELNGAPGNKNLILTTTFSPVEFNDYKPWPYNGKRFDVEVPYSCGMIKSKQSYLFGYFHIVAKLPKGNGLWPAIWLTGENSWPPEIDILEGYTNQYPDYRKGIFKNTKLNSNLHYVDNHMKKEMGAQSHPLPVDPTEEFISYSCWWTKDFIRIYYDDTLVREITDKVVLDYFSREPMKLIVNNAVRKEYLPYISNYSQMVIKEISIYQ